MSLLDALLLDPYRINIWIANRASDGVGGSGTQNDPYDGSTLTKFDTLMNGLPVNTCVHLGPGTFQTAGYYDGLIGAGWQAKSGLKIVGSGIDVTTLRLDSAATTQNAYAISHALSSSTVDFLEVRDLTIGCGFDATQGSTWTAGAIRVMGNHSRAVRLRAKNWGNKSTGNEGFVIAMLTGDPSNSVTGVTNCGIEECIVDAPHGSAAGHMIALHVGGKESASASPEAFGLGPYIRNCYVDCGETSGFTKQFRALSMAWCKSGVAEGNVVQNAWCGGPWQANTGARELSVIRNRYRNVRKGPYWNLASLGLGHVVIENNMIELATDATSSDYAVELTSGGSPYVHGVVIIRGNRIRHVDGQAGSGSGVNVANAQNLLVRENVLEVSASNPLRNNTCQTVEYFNNTTPQGVLVQGWNAGTSQKYDELETYAEDALLMALIHRS